MRCGLLAVAVCAVVGPLAEGPVVEAAGVGAQEEAGESAEEALES